MRHVIVGILLPLLLFGCSSKTTKNKKQVVQSISNCARLYTTQYNIHKIITYKDLSTFELSGPFSSDKISIPIPGDRKLVIPIDATIKTYIDFGQFAKESVQIDGDKILITLPDPKIEMTSSKIDYKNEKEYISWNRSKFSAEEKEEYLKQGKKTILSDLSHSDIIEKSRMGAFRVLQPILIEAGFPAENITLQFRDEIEGNPQSPLLFDQLIID